MLRRLALCCGLLAGVIACVAEIASIGDRQTTPATGGAATTERRNQSAFATPAPGITTHQRHRFVIGDHLFNTNWVIAPASVPTKDGLGPLFNRVSCSGCHMRDGRGRPPVEGEERLQSMLVRISVPGQGPHGGPKSHPVYGGQIQEFSIPGVPAEAQTHISWREQKGQFADGTPFSLRRPVYAFDQWGYGAVGDDLMVSGRVAPAVFGLGLLEAIPDAALMAQADPDDRNRDGISGRMNMVWDVTNATHVIGRFGWKAGQPSIKQQNAGAFLGDIGLTSSLFPMAECSATQTACQKEATFGEQPEITDSDLDVLSDYIRLLAVPARRRMDDPDVQAGEKLFYQGQCAACHTPKWQTGPSDVAVLNNQTIYPYTDLLLHDMGEGLADHRPEFLADGREWRTPPLWGIGLQKIVNSHHFFLHDGRARNLDEAILWHGGEAQKSADYFRNLDTDQRAALRAFLESL